MIGAGLVWIGLAGAAEPDDSRLAELVERNLSVTSVGLQSWTAPALGDLYADDPERSTTDLDYLFSQRLRWTLFEAGSFAARLRMDGRFTLSPGSDLLWKRSRVRQLGVSFVGRSLTVDVGRHEVLHGGPRLVDGVQAIARPSARVELGVWGGSAPDLYTTLPRARFGGGPMVAYKASRVQASLLGEVLVGGGLDRAGALAQARVSASRTIEVSGRADIELAGGPRLVDGQLFARWVPVAPMRIDVLYNAFSGYAYQQTQDLDPTIRRFDERLATDNAQFLPALLQSCVDPQIAHMVGTNFRYRGQGDGAKPVAELSGRYRPSGAVDAPPAFGEDPVCQYAASNGFFRVTPRVGLADLPIGGRVDLMLDANLIQVQGRSQSDFGLNVFFEPTDDGSLAIDASYRLILNPYEKDLNPYGYRGVGHYADLFVDVVVPAADLIVGAGLNLESEPGILEDQQTAFAEGGLGAFLRVSKYLRPRKTR